MLRAFPMILIAVALYGGTALIGPATGHDVTPLLAQNFSIPLFSGDSWKVSLGDLFVALGLLMLFIEILKATRTSRREILNHALSILTFVAALVAFITLKGFGTSTFFFLTAMCLFDVVAGYTISIVAAKRDLSVAPHTEY